MNTCPVIKIGAKNRSVTCWWKIGTCENGTGLVTAVLKGLKQRVRARNDGTRLASVGRNSHYKFIHELTGALLDPEQVRLAEIKEAEFLHTFPVFEKVRESELKGTEFVLTRWILTDRRTCQATRHSSTVCWSIVQVEVASNGKLNCSHASSRYHWNSCCHSSKRAGWVEVIKVFTRRMATSRAGCITCAFPPNSRRELYIRLPTADSKPGHVGKLLRPLCGMRDAVNAWDDCCNIAAMNKGTKLDCHHHASTYGSDVARSDGQKQVGPSPSSAVGPNMGEESASNEQPELSRETPPCRLYLVAQLAVVMRDGQWLPTVQLRGLISLVLCPVLGFVYGPRLSRFVLMSWVHEDTLTFLMWSFGPGPRRTDWLWEVCGLNAKARAVTTPGDKKLDNYDETSLNASGATSFRSWTMKLVFCCSRHSSVCGEQAYVTHATLTVGGSIRLRICVRCIHGHSQWIPPIKYDWTLQSSRSSSHLHPSQDDRTSIMTSPPTNDDIWDVQH